MIVLNEGWTGDLKCFMNEDQLIQSQSFSWVLSNNGISYLQPISIVCPASCNEIEELKDSSKVLLKLKSKGEILAIIDQPEIYLDQRDNTFSSISSDSDTNEDSENINETTKYLITGSSLKIMRSIDYSISQNKYELTPRMIRNTIDKNQYDWIYAFKLRKPINQFYLSQFESFKASLVSKGFYNSLLLLYVIENPNEYKADDLNERISECSRFISENKKELPFIITVILHPYSLT